MSNEDKYVHDREQEKIDKIRRERQLKAIQAEETEGIAHILNTTDEIAAEALALGFDKKTSRILHLVPLLQVAWADGDVDQDEKEAILSAARRNGVDDRSEAYDFLSLLMEKQPSDTFFSRVHAVIASLIESESLEKADLFREMENVADASGGLFGFGKTSASEKKLISELKTILKLDS